MRVLIFSLLLMLVSCSGGQQLAGADPAGQWAITDTETGASLTTWVITQQDGSAYFVDNLSDPDETPATLVLDGSSFIIHKSYVGYELTATGSISGDVMTGTAVQAYTDHAEQVDFTGTRQ